MESNYRRTKITLDIESKIVDIVYMNYFECENTENCSVYEEYESDLTRCASCEARLCGRCIGFCEIFCHACQDAIADGQGELVGYGQEAI